MTTWAEPERAEPELAEPEDELAVCESYRAPRASWMCPEEWFWVSPVRRPHPLPFPPPRSRCEPPGFRAPDASRVPRRGEPSASDDRTAADGWSTPRSVGAVAWRREPVFYLEGVSRGSGCLGRWY